MRRESACGDGKRKKIKTIISAFMQEQSSWHGHFGPPRRLDPTFFFYGLRLDEPHAPPRPAWHGPGHPGWVRGSGSGHEIELLSFILPYSRNKLAQLNADVDNVLIAELAEVMQFDGLSLGESRYIEIL